MSDLLKGLNKEQLQAVQNVTGPAVILAGAGSGKTRVLIHKVLNLIENNHVAPHEIVMITFTNKAAREMKDRIIRAAGTKSLLGYVGTFHSFCCMILRRDGIYIDIPRTFTIYDDGDQQQLLKEIIKKSGTKYSPRFFSAKISDAKNQLITPKRFLEKFSYYKAAEVAEVYHQYEKGLKRNNALDFDDLIMKVVELFVKHPEVLDKYQDRFQYLLVDEFQDTNVAQYVLTQKLAAKHRNITVVGDFSQSIYSWRGADIRNLDKFSEDFPDAVTTHLEQNYRSSQHILDFAYEVISENETHPILKLFTDQEAGHEITYHDADNEETEAVYVATMIEQLASETTYPEIAVLYRTNAQSRMIEEVFLHYGIPYTLIGGTRFYERKEVKDVLSYLRLFIHPADSVALERILKLGKRRFTGFKSVYESLQGQVEDIPTVELMEQTFAATEYLSLYDPEIEEDFARLENIKELKSVALSFPNIVEFLEQVALVESEYFEGEKGGKSRDGVRLMTLHQAKGLEFDNVFITGLEEGILPHSRSIDDLRQLEEERRLFYVGITRARKRLFISYA
ncbi:UvrD-helicase domain-containing protein, partial [Candidatus Woesebacteria bacterium]|nr:UvrD-helicase domain-containing protein [Candidatus Woesebacteria bacterium]